MSAPFLIVDATGYLFRAFHALGDLRTSKQHPVGAMVGTINMLDRLRQRYPTEHMVCVMDAGGKNFRHAVSEDYKANRPPLDEDLGVQIEPLQQLIKAWGIPLLQISDVEADDVIATLALAAKEHCAVIIASTDKDLMQLVDERVSLYDGMKEIQYDPDAVLKKFAVAPRQIADYLSLVGDSADNIKGVAKVGAKTAAKWLQEYESLENIINAADEFKGVVGNNLRDAIASGQLATARELVALKTDVALPRAALDYTIDECDTAAWHQLCDEFEFQKLREIINRYTGDGGGSAAADSQPARKTPTTTLTRLSELVMWIEKIRHAGAVAVNTQTRGDSIMQAQLVGCSLAITDTKSGDSEAAYIPFTHSDLSLSQLPLETAIPVLRLVLEDDAIVKILHNGKDDWHAFALHNICMQGVLEDTQILAYNAGVADTRLDALALSQLNITVTQFKELVDGKKVSDFSQVAVAAAAAYAADHADITQKIYNHLAPQLSKTERKLYEERDRPLMPLLARMEHTGVRIDSNALAATATEMRNTMQQLEARAFTEAGEEFNLNSPKQLEAILFEKLQAPAARKTGGGSRSTDERTLEKLAGDYPLAKTILEYRGLAKLVNTYAEKLPQLVDSKTGRLHTTFNQTAVLTGRLSSNSPNLQNIPIRTAEGRRIRQAFIADEGYCLLSVDYSQIELRLMAHIAEDESLCAAFHSGADIHRQTAAEVFGTPLAEVTDEQRRAAKAINFGLIYGMSAFGLARTLNIAQAQAKLYIARYFDRYGKVAAFMEQQRERAKSERTVTTAFGRRILLPVSSNKFQDVGRVAINAPIQGSAADLVKAAMLAVDDWLQKNNCRSRIILQVHDELVIETANGEEELLRAALPDLMRVENLSVPLEVNTASGNNWDEAH